MTNSVDPDQTAPIGAVCSGSKLFAPILNSSVMLGNYLQQTTSADDIFRCIFSWRFKGKQRFHMQCISLFTCFCVVIFSRVGLDGRVASAAETSHVMDTEDHMLISPRHNSHYTGRWLASHNTKMKIQKPYWI